MKRKKMKKLLSSKNDILSEESQREFLIKLNDLCEEFDLKNGNSLELSLCNLVNDALKDTQQIIKNSEKNNEN